MAVRTPDIILGISNSCIKGVIRVVASGNRNSGLVASKNNWREHCSVSFGVVGNDVLQAKLAFK